MGSIDGRHCRDARNAWPVQLPLVEMKPRGISNDRLFEASVGLDVTAGQEPFTPPMQVDRVTASFPAFFQPVFNDDRVAATVFGSRRTIGLAAPTTHAAFNSACTLALMNCVPSGGLQKSRSTDG